MMDNLNTPGRIRVGIVEDQRRTREGLRALIDGSEGFTCLGAWASMEEAIAASPSMVVDVMLCDLGLPGMSGIEGIAVLRKRRPETALVVLTVYEDNDRVFRALCAGASGYLLKNTPPAKLLDSLREAVNGGSPMSPEIARLVVELFRKFHPPEKANYNLTPQELTLLKLLVEGHSYKTAAVEMNVSINTVAFHIQNIYGKLQVHSKSEAVARALNENLLG
ncbi:MAG TPA: response regulator transcription factor [Candidatus Sulfopaludibacter sp.]|jgi:DNA-binding NarL/FixJ family response regulator|nr:response regulator transcription factor [Candidatus Sulfopaludibacter sp.]